MPASDSKRYIYYTLRFAVAMCFIGHGAFGIITKPIWCNYFAVFGIGHNMAYTLMPILGVIDILLGLSFLVYPIRAVALWLAVWGLITASLRPISGEPFAELIERAGNYGAPYMLLIFCGMSTNVTTWFSRIRVPERVSDVTWKNLQTGLTLTAFLLLAGHGWLNLIGKKGLLEQYTSLGFNNNHQAALVAGLIEIAAAILILVRPVRSIVFAFLVWKITTELFYPHWEAFEFIERAGSYGCLLALGFILPSHSSRQRNLQASDNDTQYA